MSFPAYEKYKDSGVEWLGKVPEHWEVLQTKRLFWRRKDLNTGMRCDNRLALTMRGVISRSMNDLDGLQASEFETYQIFNAGDLAFKLIDLQNIKTSRVGLVPETGIMSPAYIRLAARDAETSSNAAYWYFTDLYNRQVFNQLGGGVRQTLGPEELLTLPIPKIPANEQHAIAAFLDRETAKIDALVAEQERLIALLAEKRQAIISHAVTKGLNPDAPMKDPGIEWLGKVPEHWEVIAVRHLIMRIEQGWSPECLSRPAEIGEWGVLKTGCANHGIYQESENKALPPEVDAKTEYEVNVGDILMSRANGSPELVGSTASVTYTQNNIMLSDKIFRIELHHNILPDYYVAVFNSSLMRSQIERAISGADGLANNLPQAALKAFFCPVPPTQEQHTITTHVNRETARLDALTQEATRAIELLKERRAALISAAVTGKIDVRGLVDKEAA